MAKQIEDTRTPDLLSNEPKRRGRPATGTAMSATERKAQSRAQARADFLDGNIAGIPTTALAEMLPEWVTTGKPIFVREIMAELVKRSKAHHAENTTHPNFA